VRREAALLARAILAICALVDPERVILAGGIGSSPVLQAPLRDELRVLGATVSVMTSALGDRSGLLGALALALREAGADEGATNQPDPGGLHA
jgi:predicted NBD/HSP70 family sugar kinase